MNAPMISRRAFTAGAGGLVLAFSLDPQVMLAQQPPKLPGSLDGNRRLDAWIQIHVNGNATVSSGRASSPRWRRSRPRSSTCRSRACRSCPATRGSRPTRA